MTQSDKKRINFMTQCRKVRKGSLLAFGEAYTFTAAHPGRAGEKAAETDKEIKQKNKRERIRESDF